MKFLTDEVLRMQVGVNGTNDGKASGSMKLMEAALLMERLQARAAHAREVEALMMARDALLTIVAEGFTTLADRLGGAPEQWSGSPTRRASAERPH